MNRQHALNNELRTEGLFLQYTTSKVRERVVILPKHTLRFLRDILWGFAFAGFSSLQRRHRAGTAKNVYISY